MLGISLVAPQKDRFDWLEKQVVENSDWPTGCQLSIFFQTGPFAWRGWMVGRAMFELLFSFLFFRLTTEAVVTCGGTAQGASCQFPFDFNGTQHSECIIYGNKSGAWCATVDAKWGYCNCTKCGKGFYTQAAGTTTSQPVCTACAKGQFKNKESLKPYATDQVP